MNAMYFPQIGGLHPRERNAARKPGFMSRTLLFYLLQHGSEEVCRLSRIREIRGIRVFCFPFLRNTIFHEDHVIVHYES